LSALAEDLASTSPWTTGRATSGCRKCRTSPG